MSFLVPQKFISISSMASPIYHLLLFLLGLTARASAATFTITNNCSFTM
jgi:hypothetical protein